MKSKHRHVTLLEDVPNVGPSLAADLRMVGVKEPDQLIGSDPYRLYDKLCLATGARQDPCVLDVFISAVRYMEGAPPHPWWHYTTGRKQELARRASNSSGATRKASKRT